eukprot:15013134-Alexandrium_andersonii.AAC.1
MVEIRVCKAMPPLTVTILKLLNPLAAGPADIPCGPVHSSQGDEEEGFSDVEAFTPKRVPACF